MNDKPTNNSFNTRQATLKDVPALASLHVQTFKETHEAIPNNPTYELRKHQWQQILQQEKINHFCLVLENANNELIGFARGIPYDHPEHGNFKGELNKIYLLKKYHRLGLGRRLLCNVSEKFIRGNIFSMLLYGDAIIHRIIFMKQWVLKNYLPKTDLFTADTVGVI